MKYSVSFRGEVARAIGSGLSYSEAVQQFGVPVASVKRWARRLAAGEPLEDLPRPGAPPILTQDDVAWVGSVVEPDPALDLNALVLALEEHAGKRVSVETIRRSLAKSGLRRIRPKTQGTDRVAQPTKDRYKQHHRRENLTEKYPSSLTDLEWELLRAEFDPDGDPGRGRPREHEPRELLDAIFYVVRTGCGWRYLPKEFPPWQTVYSAFRSWSAKGRFERMHKTLAIQWRTREGRTAEPTAAIIDSQSARSTEKGGLEVTMARSA